MKNNLNQLAEVILELRDQKDVINFLEGILTPKELIEIGIRLQIVKKLKKGMPQRQIADELGVGIATVTRGSRELKRGYFTHV
jgi:TrpR family trp operon transcriptional repressor